METEEQLAEISLRTTGMSQESSDNLLAEIADGFIASPHRILIYGDEGDGKSTFASQAPKPIFIPTVDRLNHLPCAAFFKRRNPAKCVSYQEAFNCLKTLWDIQHDYQTVVIDDIGALEKLIWADVCTRRNVDSISDIDYGKGYDAAVLQWTEVLACLECLRNEKGMTVILIAHSKVDEYKHPANPAYDRFVPNLDKRASTLIRNWCDEVLFIAHKVYTTSEDEGFNKTRTRAIGKGDKVLMTTQRPSHVAKNSLNLPDELPFEKESSWSTFAKYLPN